MEVIRIEGVAFKVEAAREFAERLLIYDLINDPHPVGWVAAEGVALTIQGSITDEGRFDVRLNERQKVAVFAVLDEWLQSRGAPDAAGTLHRALASAMIDTEELERRMRPGAWSHEGFLGPDERLEDVLRADRQTLEELDLGPRQLADRLDCLLGATDVELVKEGREAVSVTVAELLFGPVEPCQLPFRLLLGELPPGAEDYYAAPIEGALVDSRFEVLVVHTCGYQECPWSPTRLGGGKPSCAIASGDWGIRDRQSGLELRGPELITHLIREHGFFEGFDSPYRVDPRALAELLQLGPFAEST